MRVAVHPDMYWMVLVVVLVGGGLLVLYAIYQRTRPWKWYELLGIFTLYPFNVFCLATPSIVEIVSVGACVWLIWVASDGRVRDWALAVAGVPIALFGIALGVYGLVSETGVP